MTKFVEVVYQWDMMAVDVSWVGEIGIAYTILSKEKTKGNNLFYYLNEN